MAKNKREWSQAEDLYLCENFHLLTQKQLAETLGVPLMTARRRLVFLGLLKSPSQESKVCQYALCARPFFITSHEVSRGFGSYCSDLCHKKSRTLLIPVDGIRKDYNAGMSVTGLCSKYSLSRGTVYNVFKRYGIEPRLIGEALKVFYASPEGEECALRRISTLEEKYGTTSVGGNKWRGGKRIDLGISVRSSWEANTLRWLDFKGVHWEYEPRVFYFDAIKRGTRTYTPDVYLPDTDQWLEIKGYLQAQSKTKLKRFKKYYPDEFSKMVGIVGSPGIATDLAFKELGIPILAYYKALEAEYKEQIPLWE